MPRTATDRLFSELTYRQHESVVVTDELTIRCIHHHSSDPATLHSAIISLLKHFDIRQNVIERYLNPDFRPKDLTFEDALDVAECNAEDRQIQAGLHSSKPTKPIEGARPCPRARRKVHCGRRRAMLE